MRRGNFKYKPEIALPFLQKSSQRQEKLSHCKEQDSSALLGQAPQSLVTHIIRGYLGVKFCGNEYNLTKLFCAKISAPYLFVPLVFKNLDQYHPTQASSLR